MRKRLLLVGIFLLCFVLPFGATVFANPYSQIVAFGDSLSDNGNADGYGLAVASNGPVWVDYLATSLVHRFINSITNVFTQDLVLSEHLIIFD